MTAPAPATALAGGVALLERATGYALGSLRLATSEALANPTPCPGWDLRTLLGHLDDALLALLGAVSTGRVGLDPVLASGEPADPVAAVRTHAAEMIGAWASPCRPGRIWIADRPLTAEIVAAAGAVEIAVHGWDVARACGQDHPLPPALAEELLDLCPLLVTPADRPTRFAPPLDPPPHSPPGARLLAYLGRRST